MHYQHAKCNHHHHHEQQEQQQQETIFYVIKIFVFVDEIKITQETSFVPLEAVVCYKTLSYDGGMKRTAAMGADKL